MPFKVEIANELIKLHGPAGALQVARFVVEETMLKRPCKTSNQKSIATK